MKAQAIEGSMGRRQKTVRQFLSAATLLALTFTLSGCGDFFVCAKSSCTTNGSSSTTTGNYAYATNSAGSATTISGYALASGTLVAATSSPYSVSYSPTAMVVSADNKYLYAASNSTVTNGVPAIYGYSRGTGGALTILNSGSALITAQVAAMDVSPDGKWLLVLTIYDGTTVPTITVYSILSTGLLQYNQAVSCSGATTGVLAPSVLKVAPSGNYIAAALGTGGVATYAFTTSAGTINTTENLTSFSPTTVGAFDLAIDTNNYLYVATTTGVQTFSSDSAGKLSTTILSTGSTTTGSTASAGPYSVAIDGTSFVYGGATTSSAGTIYGFSNNATGTVKSLTPVSVVGPTTLTKMAVDSTAKYLLTQGYSSSGLQMFAIGSGGALSLTSTVATGTTNTIPSALALTH